MTDREGFLGRCSGSGEERRIWFFVRREWESVGGGRRFFGVFAECLGYPFFEFAGSPLFVEFRVSLFIEFPGYPFV